MLTPSETGAPEARERDPLAPVTCPFCGEDGFDLYGLKTHFNMGWCEPFEAISEADRLSLPASLESQKEGAAV